MSDHIERRNIAPTVKKAQIAHAIHDAITTKAQTEKINFRHQPNFGYISDQLDEAFTELTQDPSLSHKYIGLSTRQFHSEDEVRDALAQLVIASGKENRRGNRLKDSLISKELMLGVIENLFPSEKDSE